jgi:hypothetical protein
VLSEATALPTSTSTSTTKGVVTLTDMRGGAASQVVGGLCWCITSSGEDIDVDILFQENSTIGQRIKLSETIVMALRKMQVPTPSELSLRR